MRKQARLHAAAAIVLSVAAMIVIAASDYLAAGAGVAFFYLAPILFAAWFVSRRAGFVISFLAVISALATDVLSGYYAPGAAGPYLNALLRFTLFCLSAWLITAIKDALDHEKALARTDALTDVMNARMFRELGTFEIHKARRFKRPIAVAFLDIDDFKQVNDKYGHDAGDALLQMVARTLQEHLRAADIIARLGGDEFAIILPETEPSVAPQVLEKLRGELLAAVQKGGRPITFSIGVMSFAEALPSIDEMLRLTDLVMYEVKHAGKNKLKHVVWPAEIGAGVGTLPTAQSGPAGASALPATYGSREPGRRVVATVGGAAGRTGTIWNWAPAVALLVVCLFATAFALDSVVQSLPGSSLYPFKRESENVQLMFAQTPVNSVRFHLTMADRRLAETAALLNLAEYDLSEESSLEYENEIETTLDVIDTAPMQVSLDLLQTVAEHLTAQQGQLTRLAEQGPPRARTIVEHSRAKSHAVSDRLTATAARVVITRLNLATPVVVPTPQAGTVTVATATPTRADGVGAATATLGTAPSSTPTLDPFLATSTASATDYGQPTEIASATPTASRTVPPVPVAPTGTASATPLNFTATSTPPPTAVPAAVGTATSHPTQTQIPTASTTATASNTSTTAPSRTPTSTASPTGTPTRTPLPSRTPTETRTPDPTGEPDACDRQKSVPLLIGKNPAAALKAWRAAGFIGDFRSWDDQSQELVTKQQPEAGSLRSVCSDMKVDNDKN